MIPLRWLLSLMTRTPSASAARERLLGDGVMRASRVRRAAAAHQATLHSIPAARGVREAAENSAYPEAPLPPHEQRRRLIEIAASYDEYYLAAVEFVAERGITIGTIKPVRSAAGHPEEAHEICVDARGDISISLSCHRLAPPSALPLGRLVMWLVALVIALGVAAYLL